MNISPLRMQYAFQQRTSFGNQKQVKSENVPTADPKKIRAAAEEYASQPNCATEVFKLARGKQPMNTEAVIKLRTSEEEMHAILKELQSRPNTKVNVAKLTYHVNEPLHYSDAEKIRELAQKATFESDAEAAEFLKSTLPRVGEILDNISEE